MLNLRESKVFDVVVVVVEIGFEMLVFIVEK